MSPFRKPKQKPVTKQMVEVAIDKGIEKAKNYNKEIRQKSLREENDRLRQVEQEVSQYHTMCQTAEQRFNEWVEKKFEKVDWPAKMKESAREYLWDVWQEALCMKEEGE